MVKSKNTCKQNGFENEEGALMIIILTNDVDDVDEGG